MLSPDILAEMMIKNTQNIYLATAEPGARLDMQQLEAMARGFAVAIIAQLAVAQGTAPVAPFGAAQLFGLY